MINKKILNFKKNIKSVKNYLDINSNQERLQIFLYDDIDEYLISETQYILLNNNNYLKSIDIHINSYGGDVMYGTQFIAMVLKKKKETGCVINVYIDGWAVSMASVIAIALADNLYLNKTSLMMIHLPLCNPGYANRIELEKTLEFLHKNEENIFNVYREKIDKKISDEEITKMLEEETWLDSNQIRNLFAKINISNDETYDIPVYNSLAIKEMEDELKIPKTVLDIYKEISDENENKNKIKNEFLKEYLKAFRNSI